MSVFAGVPVAGMLVAIALVVLVVRLAGALRREGARSVARRMLNVWPDALARPVWPALLAVAVGSAALTAALEQLYLLALPEGARWGADIALLFVTLGVLVGVLGTLLVGLAGACVAHFRGFAAGGVAGVLLLAAIVGGTLVAHLPLRAAYAQSPGAFASVSHLEPAQLLIPFEVCLTILVCALPWPVLGAALGARRRAVPATTRDAWQRLLDLATAQLPVHRCSWGAALRAELAAIEPPAERRSFALGGARAALWSSPPRETVWWVLSLAVVVAAGTFAASRWSLAHGAGGILGFWVVVPGLLLAIVALVTAWRTRSFGSALQTTFLAGLASLVALLAVGIPEAVVWARPGGGYLTTGDAIPPSWQAAVLDLLRPEFLGGYVAVWTAMAAGGAAIGLAAKRPDRRPVAQISVS
ncbi:MAG TPA: hypothetical protein VEX66_11420 [Microlunatus sp.]|nr:hypothetical protein [Microlunatus sp.]